MRRAATKEETDKFGRYRANQRARGMKLLRVWVPDPRAPGFRDEARRQAASLRGSPDGANALDFIEGATLDLLERE